MFSLEVRKPVSEKVISEPVKGPDTEKSRQRGEQVQSPKMGTLWWGWTQTSLERMKLVKQLVTRGEKDQFGRNNPAI